MRGYRIQIIRHGETKANYEKIYIGKTDLPLTEESKESLRKMRDSYTYPYAERVYSSPLERCIQTAEILYPDTDITIVDDLREMDFGIFENMKFEDALRLDTYKEWIKGGLDNAPPNGESGRSVLLRCYASMDAIVMDMMKQDIHNAAIVTHGMIVSNILGGMGLPKRNSAEYLCNPGTGFMINVNAMLWQNGQTFEVLSYVPEEMND